jgi:glycosyltransferase involved in cell wall biosynthesis
VASDGAQVAGRSDRPLRILCSLPDTLGAPGIGVAARNHTYELARLGHEVHVYCTAVAGEPPDVHRLVTTLSVAGVRTPASGLRPGARVSLPRPARRRGALAPRGRDRRRPRLAARDAGDGRHRATCRRSHPSGGAHTHTAFAYERVAEETARLGLIAAAGHSHEGTAEACGWRSGSTRRRTWWRSSRSTSGERSSTAALLPSASGYTRTDFDPERFPAPEDGRPSRDGGLRAVFVGRCEPRKGLHYALEAWTASGAAERGTLAICGNFYPGYEQVLERWLRHPSVHVQGWVDDPGRADARERRVPLPVDRGGSAFVTYEAQARGCALVVSDATGARCRRLEQGLVHEAGDLTTLTEHLRLLDGDPELLERLRANAVASRPTLTWAHSARGIEGLYRELVAR